MVAQDVSLFAQDEWRLGRLTLKPGVRYQRQFWRDYTYKVSDVGGSSFSYPFPSDPNNVAPRVALAYDLTGDGRTSLHGSYGMFYENTYTTVASVSRDRDRRRRRRADAGARGAARRARVERAGPSAHRGAGERARSAGRIPSTKSRSTRH